MNPNKSFFRIPGASLFSEPSTWVLIAVNLIPFAGVLFWNWDLFSLMVLYWMETAMIGFYQLIKILVNMPLFAIFLIPFFTFHFGMFMKVHFMFISALFGPPWARALHDSILAILNRLLFEERFWIPALALFISHGVSFFLHGLKATPNPALEALNNKIKNNEIRVAVHHPTSNPAAYHPTEDWQHMVDPTPAKPFESSPGGTASLSPAQQQIAKLLVANASGMDGNMMFEPYKRVIVMHITIILGGILSQVIGNSQSAMLVMVAMKISADLFSHANYHGLGGRSSSPESSFEPERKAV
jgi:hypothetical protein